MSNYKDRGILKWAPFDALTGHNEMISDLIFNLAKKEKPELSEDEFEELNNTIEKAVSNNLCLSIDYYENGYVITTYGKIKKVDSVKKILYLDTEEEVSFDSIIQAKIVRS
jgi:hypothetical protein